MKRVLIVDDSRSCRRLYQKELTSGSYEVVMAKDGIEALECINKLEIDLVVLDIQMPNMNGYEVCERLRSKEFSHRFLQKRDGVLPIIFVTSNTSLDVRLKGFNKGATDFIIKGFKPGALLARVNSTLRPPNPLSGMTALVADSSSFHREMVAAFLKEKGIKPLTVDDGARAFEIMYEKRDEIDMVITDLEISGMRGDVLCKRLRDDLGLKNIPIIVITASENRKMLLNLFEAGASDYLIKPFEQEDLLARLKASLKSINAMENMIEARVRAESHALLKEEKAVHARVAGDARIATSVLHNIGNVLNSVTSSCFEISRMLKSSKLTQLILAHEMIDENRDNLSTFFTEDPKGKILPNYLVKSSAKVNNEHTLMAREIEEIFTRISLMKDIIDTQQAHARGRTFIEEMALEDLVEDALKVLQPTMKSWNITLERDLAPMGPVPVERVSLAHVLINLIKNAVEAMRDQQTRVLTVRIFSEDGFPSIMVKDTGSGITPENMTKVFTHGFTTKDDGHGFGLAFCSGAIERMGGDLSVKSPGAGEGATFLIRFGSA